MKEYICPKAEFISFESENILAASKKGCNCFADRWNEGHAIDSGCEGDSVDYSEVLWSE